MRHKNNVSASYAIHKINFFLALTLVEKPTHLGGTYRHIIYGSAPPREKVLQIEWNKL